MLSLISKMLLMYKLLKDKSDFSDENIRREWIGSNNVEFDAHLLNLKDTVFIDRLNHHSKTRVLLVNSLPIYPPLECENEECDDLANFALFIVPSSDFPVPSYVGFPADDSEHKTVGTATFVCLPHLKDFIGLFHNCKFTNIH